MGWSQFTSHNFVSAAPSSCFSTAPAWGTSHRIQSFRNFSGVAPSHREQSFGNKLLQCGPSTHPAPKTFSCTGPLPQATVPAWNLLHCRVSMGCSCPQGSFPSRGVLHGLQGDNVQHQSFPARESVLQCLGHILPLLLH